MFDLGSSLSNIQYLLDAGYITDAQHLLRRMRQCCRTLHAEVYIPKYQIENHAFGHRCKKEAAMRLGALLYEEGFIEMDTVLSESAEDKRIVARLQVYKGDQCTRE